jgi:hypothetical protein
MLLVMIEKNLPFRRSECAIAPLSFQDYACGIEYPGTLTPHYQDVINHYRTISFSGKDLPIQYPVKIRTSA